MLEFFTGLILGMGWWLLAPLVLFSILFDHCDRYGWSFIFTLLAALSFGVFFSVESTTLLWIVAAYIPVGFLWSFWRWRRHCDRVVDEAGEEPVDYDIRQAERRLNIKQNLDKVTYWVACWPISVVSSLAEDLIDAIQRAILRISKNTYEKWSGNALEKIKQKEVKEG